MDENRNEVGGGQLIAGYLGIILMLIGGIILLPIMSAWFIRRNLCMPAALRYRALRQYWQVMLCLCLSAAVISGGLLDIRMR